MRNLFSRVHALDFFCALSDRPFLEFHHLRISWKAQKREKLMKFAWRNFGYKNRKRNQASEMGSRCRLEKLEIIDFSRAWCLSFLDSLCSDFFLFSLLGIRQKLLIPSLRGEVCQVFKAGFLCWRGWFGGFGMVGNFLKIFKGLFGGFVTILKKFKIFELFKFFKYF